MSNFTWEFGPSFDRNRTDILPIAYVAVPKLTSDRGVVKLAAERLFYGNYPHQERVDLTAAVLGVSGYDSLLLNIQSSGAVFDGTRYGAFQETQAFDPPFSISLINQPLRIQGIEEDLTGRWRVVMKPGSLYRKSSIYSTEPEDSWLRKTGLVTGDDVYLLYGLPEYWYGNTYGGFNSTTWGASDFSASLRTEILNPITSHEVRVHFTPLIGVESVWLNDTLLSSGFWDGSEDNSLMLSMDSEDGFINFRRSFAPSDEITVQYYTPREDYTFGGFSSPGSGYYSLDLNPEEGHYTRDPKTGYYYNTRDILANGVQLYLIPCAAFTLTGTMTYDDIAWVPPELATLSGSGLLAFKFDGADPDSYFYNGLGHLTIDGTASGYWSHLQAPATGSTVTHFNNRTDLSPNNVQRFIGFLQFPVSGYWKFLINHDDGFRMWMLDDDQLPPEGDDPTSIDSWWHQDWTTEFTINGETQRFNKNYTTITPSTLWRNNDGTVAEYSSSRLVKKGTLYPVKMELVNALNNAHLTIKAAVSGSTYTLVTSSMMHKPTVRDETYLINPTVQTPTATGIMQFYSAFDYGETHFLRYQLGSANDEVIAEVDPSVIGYLTQETWGYGQCGRARYRSYGSAEPSWNANFPSSIALGHLMAAPPVNVETVRIADVRQRGGGISEDLQQFYTQVGSGVADRVAGFWDMSLWEGPTVKEGGSVQVSLPEELLSTMSETAIRELVMRRIPPGIELLLTFTPSAIPVEPPPTPDDVYADFVFIPAGTFLMGNSGEGYDAYVTSRSPSMTEAEFPQHTVNLTDYWIGRYEVTRAQYRAFMEDEHLGKGYETEVYWSAAGWAWVQSQGRTHPETNHAIGEEPTQDYWTAEQHLGYDEFSAQSFTQTDLHPVMGLSYYEAEAYCNWFSLKYNVAAHIPTEAQWEKAARWDPSTSHPRIYPWGDDWNDDYCNNWFDNKSAGGGQYQFKTVPVNSPDYLTDVSYYGVYGMAGNVAEWVQEWSKSYAGSSDPFDDTGSQRLVRGWSAWPKANENVIWRTHAVDPYYDGVKNAARCANRWETYWVGAPYGPWPFFGLRVAIGGSEIPVVEQQIPTIERVKVPAGSFLMGNSAVNDDYVYRFSAREFPQHSVYLADYWISKYETTRAEFRKFILANGYTTSSYWSTAGWAWKNSEGRTEPRNWTAVGQEENYPVIGTSWYEAEAFCNWVGGFLPTEEQWEKAARWDADASHPRIYPWGDTWNASYLNYSYVVGHTEAVTSYELGKSYYGCMNMAGNASEWTRDWFVTYPGVAQGSYQDLTGEIKTIRGGNYLAPRQFARCADRSGGTNPWDYPVDAGFRVIWESI